ncbi:p-loop containing nucleoside triphosphate hydrolase [Fusarium sporotrichioides]|uniref:p-loop containing nucleoside triphosphate hydrolase n=1 Tax=Fusarium sporotrichioides TaxID=5514 RepID=A0A395RTW6_FUSSP|nr:p-loop containing nucleoside triphosphate hydrolase [Fusarium sporotrichioides]
MAGKLLGRVVPSDRELLKLLRKIDRSRKLPLWTSTPFDIVVLDEFQDCNPETFWLVACFLRSNNVAKEGQPARIVVLGDERQSIYRFRDADPRYLTLAPELLGPISPYPFTEVQLGNSFRLPIPTVEFINRGFLGGEQYISSSKHGPKPIVLRCDLKDSDTLAEKLSPLIKRNGPENCAIIAPSVRKSKPLKNLTNTLAKVHGIPISVPTDDEAPLNDQVIHGKMCISTIHQFKGRERELVILLGMDSSYLRYYGRDLPDDKCPNEVFVALTRALGQLVLLNDYEDKMMPCVSVDAVYGTAEVTNMTSDETDILPPDLPGRPLELGLLLPMSCTASEIARYIQGDALDKVVKRFLHVKRVSPRLSVHGRINIQNVVASDTQKGFFESVSDINGLVIAAALELETSGALRSLGVRQEEVNRNMPRHPQRLVSWLCRLACNYEAQQSGYQPRMIQMEHHRFDWMRHEDLELARRRLDKELVDTTRHLNFEVGMSGKFLVDDQITKLSGRADIVTSSPGNRDGENDKTIWEIKFVSQLTNEHIIQACVYGYLLGSSPAYGKLPRIILYNVRDGDKREIIPRDGLAGLRKLIKSVLRLRYTATGEVSYEEFIQRCTETTQKVMNLSDGKNEG